MKVISMISMSLLTFLFSTPVLAVVDGQTFKDWKVQCATPVTGGNAQDCHIFQRLVSKDSKTRVLQIDIGYVRGRNDPAAIVTLPLGIALPHGIAISVDGKTPAKFPYQACFKTGCQAGFPMHEQMQAAFRNGTQAVVRFYDLNDQPIDIPVSLSGFSAAINTINPVK